MPLTAIWVGHFMLTVGKFGENFPISAPVNEGLPAQEPSAFTPTHHRVRLNTTAWPRMFVPAWPCRPTSTLVPQLMLYGFPPVPPALCNVTSCARADTGVRTLVRVTIAARNTPQRENG